MKPLCIDLYVGLTERSCLHCGIPLGHCRPDKTCCSTRCYQCHRDKRPSFPSQRACRVCCSLFIVATRADANRKYCSQNCSRKASAKGIGIWNKLHPGKLKEYRQHQLDKDPSYWGRIRREQRKTILVKLGGRCVVCGASNPNWLHVDYIPTTRNERYRHSRTLKFTLANLALFRILCANHHYELTLTGKIEGTDIVQ